MKMELPIITLKEYIELEDKSEYDFFMKYFFESEYDNRSFWMVVGSGKRM